MFAIGLGIFTLASAAAALAPSIEALVAARAVQGVGGAIVTPLTLTILSAAVPAEKRGARARRLGRDRRPRRRARPARRRRRRLRPLLAVDLLAQRPDRARADPARAARGSTRRHGPTGELDLPRPRPRQRRPVRDRLGPRPRQRRRAGRARRSSLSLALGARARRRVRRSGSSAPRRRCCRCASSATATFALTNVASLLMFFGMFGSIFLLAQFFQTVQGYSPLRLGAADPAVDGDADLRRPDRRRALRPDRRPAADGAPGSRSRRSGSAGSRRSRRRRRRTSTSSCRSSSPGVGMALFFAPVANVVLSSVRPEEEGQASGANNAIRELGGVFGVAVLASIFAHYGGYETGRDVRRRASTPAIWVGAVVVALGCASPRSRSRAGRAASRAALEPAAWSRLGRGSRAAPSRRGPAVRGAVGLARVGLLSDGHGPARTWPGRVTRWRSRRKRGGARALGRRDRASTRPPRSRSSHRRATVAALAGRDFELIFVDDGSTDGIVRELVERLRAADARVHGVQLKRNFGQHPAMHAGLARARGEIVVTMDGDLQNPPEDLPKLVAAVESGYDVASGRRAARRDSWGRTLPSRLINGMLRRFTARATSPTSAARSTRTGARRSSPCSARSASRSSRRRSSSRRGASVVEVDVGHAARADASRYSPLRLVRTRAQRARRLLAAADPVDRARARRRLHALRASASGSGASSTGSTTRTSPGPLFGGVAVLFVLGVQGFILALVGEYLGRIQRDVAGRPLYTIDARSLMRQKRVLVTGGAGFISSTFVRHLLEATPYEVVSLDALTYAGNLENLADVMAHERLSFVHGDIRDRELVRAARLRGGRDRQRRRRVARREVDRGGRLGVRDARTSRARRSCSTRPRDAGRALHPDLVERGVRDGGDRPDGRGAPAEPALAVRGDEGGRRTGSRTRTGRPTSCRS